jgi:hypothetical protein
MELEHKKTKTVHMTQTVSEKHHRVTTKSNYLFDLTVASSTMFCEPFYMRTAPRTVCHRSSKVTSRLSRAE